LYVAIRNLFQANKESKAIYLHNEFHSMLQGDLSINAYCQQMKELADALKDVGHPVSEPQLVLNLLRGLNPAFSNTADHIAEQEPFPSFSKARAMLALKEQRNANATKVAASTALISNSTCGSGSCRGGPAPPAPLALASLGGSTSPTPPTQGARTSGNGSGGSGNRRNNCRRNGGGGGGNGGGGGWNNGQCQQAQGSFPGAPWVCVNPWAFPGSGASGFPRNFGPGLLGSHPQQQAHTAFAPSQLSVPSTPQWDPSGFVAVMNQLSMQPSDGWVVDTGASQHMASNDGILLSRSPTNVSAITVGNGATLPITARGHSVLHTPLSNFNLNNVLIVPSIIRNLLSVKCFTRDNLCSIEFDPFGFFVKDLRTRRVILRCSSPGDLYTITPAAVAFVAAHAARAQCNARVFSSK
jgi:hypothetical protein